MSSLITNAQSSHWYEKTQSGWEARYEVLGKNGNLRKPTLRDARAGNWSPSVTGIIDILRKPGLEQWKLEQAVLASLSLPRVDGEPLDQFARRVVEDAEAQSAKARDLGTAVHNACEVYAVSRAQVEGDLRPYVEAFYAWFDDNVTAVWGAETIVGDAALGVAGRLDLHCSLKDAGETVVDFKTQGIKEGKKPVFYDEWPVQLVVYSHCITSDQRLSRLSLIINTTKPDGVFCQYWPKETAQHDWEIFQMLHKLWQWKNNYFPSQSSTKGGHN